MLKIFKNEKFIETNNGLFESQEGDLIVRRNADGLIVEIMDDPQYNHAGKSNIYSVDKPINWTEQSKTTPCECDSPADILYFEDTSNGRVQTIRCMDCGEQWKQQQHI